MGIQVVRDVAVERSPDPGVMWRNSLWAFVLSNPQVVVPTPRLRTPDLVLTTDAAARFSALANQPYDPAASKTNLRHAVESLKRRRTRDTQKSQSPE